MIQIIKHIINDACEASVDTQVMVCSSEQKAKEIILKDINDGFEASWKSLKEAESELSKELEQCQCSENETSFVWFDNAKGESYDIVTIDETKIDKEYQQV